MATDHVYIREESEKLYRGYVQYFVSDGLNRIYFELMLLRPSAEIEGMTAWAPHETRREIAQNCISLVLTKTEGPGRIGDLGRVTSAEIKDETARGTLEGDVLSAYAALISLKAIYKGVQEYTFELADDDEEDLSDWPINLDM